MTSVQARIAREGLSDLVDRRNSRIIATNAVIYDRIVSIEMFEAVGETLVADLFPAIARAADGWRSRGPSGHHDRRAEFSRATGGNSISSAATSFPAACCRRATSSTNSAPRRASCRWRTHVWRGLRTDACGMARPFPRLMAGDHASRFRRAIPPAVGILLVLLRGGIPRWHDRRAAGRFRKGVIL